MDYVEIYSFITGKQETVGYIELEDNVITFRELPTKFVDRIREDGIKGDDAEVFFPEDGIRFLEALRYRFSGSMLRASEVKSG